MATDQDLIRGLRCSASAGEHPCEGCCWLMVEALPAELARELGIPEDFGPWTSCDVDRMALEAADRLEALTQKRTAAPGNTGSGGNAKHTKRSIPWN